MTQDAYLDYSSSIDPFEAQWEWTDSNGALHVEPFIFPDPEGKLEEHIRKYVAPDLERDFVDDPITWVNEELRKADLFDVKKNERITPSWFSSAKPPKPRLNVLYFPTCASLYAHIVAVFDTDQITVGQKVTLKLNRTIVQNATFFLGIEDKREIDLYVVASRPLNGEKVASWSDYTNASVCVLVDWRFFGRKIIHSAVEFENIPGYLKGTLDEEGIESNKITIVNSDVTRAVNEEDVPYDSYCNNYARLTVQLYETKSSSLSDFSDSYATPINIFYSHFLHSSQYDGEACCCATAGSCTMVRLFWNLFTTNLFSESDFKAATTNSSYFAIFSEEDESKYKSLLGDFYTKSNSTINQEEDSTNSEEGTSTDAEGGQSDANKENEQTTIVSEEPNIPDFNEEIALRRIERYLEFYKQGWKLRVQKSTDIKGYGVKDNEDKVEQPINNTLDVEDALYGKSLVNINAADPYSSSAFPYSNNVPAVIVLDIMLATYGQRLYAGDGSVVSYLIKKESLEEEIYQKAFNEGVHYFSPRAPVIVCAKVNNARIQTLLQQQVSKNQKELALLDESFKRLAEKDYSDDYIDIKGPSIVYLRTGEINDELIIKPYYAFRNLSKNGAPDIYAKIPDIPELTYENDSLNLESSKETVVKFVDQLIQLYNEFVEYLSANDATLSDGSIRDVEDELLLSYDYTGDVSNSEERAVNNVPGDYYAPRYWTRENAIITEEEGSGENAVEENNAHSIDATTEVVTNEEKEIYLQKKKEYYAKTFNERIVEKESDYISLDFPDDYNELKSSIVVFTDYEVACERVAYRGSVSETNKKINIISESVFRGVAQRIASAVESLQRLPDEYFLYLGCDLGNGVVYKTDAPMSMRQTRALSFPSSVHWPTGAFSRILGVNSDVNIVRVVAKREDTCSVTVEHSAKDAVDSIVTTYKVSPKMAYALVRETIHPEETVYFTWGARGIENTSQRIGGMSLNRSITYNDPEEADFSFEGPALLSEKDFSYGAPFSNSDPYKSKKLIRWNGVSITGITYSEDGVTRADGVVDHYSYGGGKYKNIVFDKCFSVTKGVKNCNSREGEVLPSGVIADHHNVINVLDYPQYIIEPDPNDPPKNMGEYFEKLISEEGKSFFRNLATQLLTDNVVKGINEDIIEEESVTISLSSDVCKYTAGVGIKIQTPVEDSSPDPDGQVFIEGEGKYSLENPEEWDKNSLAKKEISVNLIPGSNVVITYPNGEEKRGAGTDFESLDPDGYAEAIKNLPTDDNGEIIEEIELPEEYKTKYPDNGDGGVLVSVLLPKKKKEEQIDYDHESKISSENEDDIEDLLYENGEFIHGSDPSKWPGGEEYWDATLTPGMTVELNGPGTGVIGNTETSVVEDGEILAEENSDSSLYFRHTYNFLCSDDIEINQIDGTKVEYVEDFDGKRLRNVRCTSSDIKLSWKGISVIGMGAERTYVHKIHAGSGLTLTVHDATRRLPTATAVIEWKGLFTGLNQDNHDDIENDYTGYVHSIIEGSGVVFEKVGEIIVGKDDETGEPIKQSGIRIHSKPATIKGASHIKVESSKFPLGNKFDNVFDVSWTGFNAFKKNSDTEYEEATGLKAGSDIYFKVSQVGETDDSKENVLEISGTPQPSLIGKQGITVTDTSEQEGNVNSDEPPKESVYEISWDGLQCDGFYAKGITAGEGIIISDSGNGTAVITIDDSASPHPTIQGDEKYILVDFNDADNFWKISLDIDEVVKAVKSEINKEPLISIKPVDSENDPSGGDGTGESGDGTGSGGETGGAGSGDGSGESGETGGTGSGGTSGGSGGTGGSSSEGSDGTINRGPGLNVDSDGYLSWAPERSNAITDPYLSQKAAVGLCNEKTTPLKTSTDVNGDSSTDAETTVKNGVVTSLGAAETKDVLAIPEGGFEKVAIPTRYVAEPISVFSGYDNPEKKTVLNHLNYHRSQFVSDIATAKMSLKSLFVAKEVITALSVNKDATVGAVQVVTDVACDQDGHLKITYGYITPKKETVYVLEKDAELIADVTPTHSYALDEFSPMTTEVIGDLGNPKKEEVKIAISNPEVYRVEVLSSFDEDFLKVSAITGLPNVKAAELDLVQIPIGATLSDAAACPGNVPCPDVKISPHINSDDIIKE